MHFFLLSTAFQFLQMWIKIRQKRGSDILQIKNHTKIERGAGLKKKTKKKQAQNQQNNNLCKLDIIFALAIFWFHLGDNKALEQLAQSSQESVPVLKKALVNLVWTCC